MSSFAKKQTCQGIYQPKPNCWKGSIEKWIVDAKCWSADANSIEENCAKGVKLISKSRMYGL